MRSIERRFKNITEKKPFWSSYICFTEAIKGQKFTKSMISRWFSKLIEKDDYSKSDRKSLLSQLEKLSNPIEDTQL